VKEQNSIFAIDQLEKLIPKYIKNHCVTCIKCKWCVTCGDCLCEPDQSGDEETKEKGPISQPQSEAD
jgi:hypothetical protein